MQIASCGDVPQKGNIKTEEVFGDHAKMEAGTIFFLATVVKEEQLEEAVTESPLSCYDVKIKFHKFWSNLLL